MVDIFEARTLRPMDMDSLFDQLEQCDAPILSPAFMAEAAECLQRFNANGNSVHNHIDRCGGLDAARNSFVPPQTFFLGGRGIFALRANVWPPLNQQQSYARHEEMLYAYELAHDHDFSFLTIGNFGPGYWTDLYEVEPHLITGEAGQPIDFHNHRREQLTEGRVFAFYAYRDVHTQHVPEALSISVNLLITGQNRGREQMFFDPANNKVLSPAHDGAVGRMLLAVELAVAFPTRQTFALLEQAAATSPFSKVRQRALHHLEAISRTHKIALKQVAPDA